MMYQVRGSFEVKLEPQAAAPAIAEAGIVFDRIETRVERLELLPDALDARRRVGQQVIGVAGEV